MGNARTNATDIQRGETMSELKRDYWSDTLVCVSGKVKIDRREIAAVVICNQEVVLETPRDKVFLENWKEINGDGHHLDIHLKSGSIFTVTEWDVNTIANLYLTESPHEEVKVIPNGRYIRGKWKEAQE